jgi:hypothetical protein
VICKDCDRYVDSDDDPDCFVIEDRTSDTIVLCEACRGWSDNEQWRYEVEKANEPRNV